MLIVSSLLLAKGVNVADQTSSGVKGKQATRFVCSTPVDKCRGASGERDKIKVHSTMDQVRSCTVNYLLSLGYKKLSSREFENPETGSILVLNKKPLRSKPGKGGRPMLPRPRVINSK
jgi:hypothetical protein